MLQVSRQRVPAEPLFTNARTRHVRWMHDARLNIPKSRNGTGIYREVWVQKLQDIS
jgi:hypothetical protein